MEGAVAVIVLLFWIARGLVRFVQWAVREAQGLNRPLPGVTPPAQSDALPMTPREPLRNIGRPAGDDASPVPMPATSAGFARREAQLSQYEETLSSRQTLPVPSRAPQTERSLQTLFGASDDLLRAFIMQEVLKPPRRLTPPPPRPAAPSSPASGTSPS